VHVRADYAGALLDITSRRQLRGMTLDESVTAPSI
jgi:hypothetical protein